MSKHLPWLKIQSSGGRDFGDFFHRLFEAGGKDVEDIRLTFPRGLKRVTYSSRADLGAGVNGFLEGSAWV